MIEHREAPSDSPRVARAAEFELSEIVRIALRRRFEGVSDDTTYLDQPSFLAWSVASSTT
jgi:hypothetical protein